MIKVLLTMSSRRRLRLVEDYDDDVGIDDADPNDIDSYDAYDINSRQDLGQSSHGEFVPESSNSRNTRGETQMADQWTGKTRVPMRFDEHCMAVGDDSGTFNNFLGTVARRATILPPTKSDWREVQKSLKEEAWNIVLRAFIIDGTEAERVKSTCLRHMGKLWKDHKVRLKQRIDGCDTMAEKLARCPEHVPEPMWETLVLFWDSEEGKRRSERNKANRGKQIHKHAGGTKSLARLAEEDFQKTGVRPSRKDLWIKSHTRKDGTPIDQAAADVISKLRELEASTPPASGASETGPNDLLAQVLGPEKRGRVRGLGFGATPTNTFGSSSSKTSPPSQEVIHLRQKVSYLEHNQHVMEQNQHVMEQNQQVMKSQLEQLLQQLGRKEQRRRTRKERRNHGEEEDSEDEEM